MNTTVTDGHDCDILRPVMLSDGIDLQSFIRTTTNNSVTGPIPAHNLLCKFTMKRQH